MTTNHARCRKQQRNIQLIVIDWLQRYGEERFDGRGGVIRYFGHDSRRRMERHLGRRFVAENQKYLDNYLVESAEDGTILTMGVRFKRIPRR